jgi:hypothetical protein
LRANHATDSTKGGIGGFRAKTYASDLFSRVLTVYFLRAAAATTDLAKRAGLRVAIVAAAN